MGRGKRWTRKEDAIIKNMLDQGATLYEIARTLPNRTIQAVEKRISRLNLYCRQTKKKIFPTILAERVIEHEEVVKILLGVIAKNTGEDKETFYVRGHNIQIFDNVKVRGFEKIVFHCLDYILSRASIPRRFRMFPTVILNASTKLSLASLSAGFPAFRTGSFA